MKTTYGFSRRGPDHVTEELVSVLSKKTSFEFKSLFLIVHANLRARNAASGGEEMLRLRAYEKLQNLVQAGIVKKTDKKYRGITAALAAFVETAAELNARFAAGTHSRPPSVPMPSPAPVPAPVAVIVPVAPRKLAAPRKVAAPRKTRATRKATTAPRKTNGSRKTNGARKANGARKVLAKVRR